MLPKRKNFLRRTDNGFWLSRRSVVVVADELHRNDDNLVSERFDELCVSSLNVDIL